MKSFKCQANLRYGVVSTLMAVLIAVSGASSKGDDTRLKEKDDRLEDRLQGISNQELLAIIEGGDAPVAIGALQATPERINAAVMAELARRLDPKLNSPGVIALKASAEPEIVVPKLNPARDGNMTTKTVNGEIGVGQMSAEPAEVRLANVIVESIVGEPFAVGMVELLYEPGHGPIIYPDQPLFFDSTEQRAHYFAYDISYQDSENTPTMMVDRLRVSFLLRGSDSCQVSISSVDGSLLAKKDVEPNTNGDRHGVMLQQWWKQFSVIPTNYGLEQRELKESLLDILARRLQLPGPWPKVAKNGVGGNETNLEHQFEHGIGMLFGIESVKLAMLADTALSQSGRFEKADQAIPVRRDLQSVVIP